MIESSQYSNSGRHEQTTAQDKKRGVSPHLLVYGRTIPAGADQPISDPDRPGSSGKRNDTQAGNSGTDAGPYYYSGYMGKPQARTFHPEHIAVDTDLIVPPAADTPSTIDVNTL